MKQFCEASGSFTTYKYASISADSRDRYNTNESSGTHCHLKEREDSPLWSWCLIFSIWSISGLFTHRAGYDKPLQIHALWCAYGTLSRNIAPSSSDASKCIANAIVRMPWSPHLYNQNPPMECSDGSLRKWAYRMSSRTTFSWSN